MDRHMTLPLSEAEARTLRAGDYVYLTGVLYTARDAAHKRMYDALKAGEELPVDLRGQLVYYLGPTPARPGHVIGSAGPTTSSRMDKYAPELLDLGLRGMVGKGKRTQAVIDAIVRNGAVYFAAVGGAGALCGNAVVSCECVAFADLLSEAVYKMELKDLPAVVAADAFGGDVYAASRDTK